MHIKIIPEKIPIIREKDYHTHHIGFYDGEKQFMGFIVAHLDPPVSEGWETRKRWYSVLYLFDADGNLTETKWTCWGTTADGEHDVTKNARKQLEQWLHELGSYEYCDVKIKLFTTQVEGNVFGLIPATELGYFDPDEDPPDMQYDVHLVPNDLVFSPPWTGEYDT